MILLSARIVETFALYTITKDIKRLFDTNLSTQKQRQVVLETDLRFRAYKDCFTPNDS